MLAGRYCSVTTRMEESMSKLTDIEKAANEFDAELHKLIRHAKKHTEMLWPDVVEKLELVRTDVRAMMKGGD
jgi:hypothetical protein